MHRAEYDKRTQRARAHAWARRWRPKYALITELTHWADQTQVETKYDELLSEHNAMLVDAKKQQQDFIRRFTSLVSSLV